MRTHTADAIDSYEWLDQLQAAQERNDVRPHVCVKCDERCDCGHLSSDCDWCSTCAPGAEADGIQVAPWNAEISTSGSKRDKYIGEGCDENDHVACDGLSQEKIDGKWSAVSCECDCHLIGHFGFKADQVREGMR
jgi:hypothetical protein